MIVVNRVESVLPEHAGNSQCRIGMMMRLVCSAVNAPVENPEMTTAQASAGHHVFSQRTLEFSGGAELHYSSL